ncbi:MAG: NAD-dependent epimerase/dehydratase family protein, partial [Bdellovibrionota bacterium]
MKPDQQLLGSVLVTGGSGYLGELLYLRLKNLGVPVRNLDVIPPYITQYRTDWIEADITQSLPRGGLAIDTVFHAAAAVPLARDKEKFYRINAEGTKKVIEWSYEMGARNFIYISSSAVFGRNRKSPGAISGNDSPSPCEDYGRSKLLGEKYVAEFVEKYPDMKACI